MMRSEPRGLAAPGSAVALHRMHGDSDREARFCDSSGGHLRRSESECGAVSTDVSDLADDALATMLGC